MISLDQLVYASSCSPILSSREEAYKKHRSEQLSPVVYHMTHENRRSVIECDAVLDLTGEGTTYLF